LFLGSFGAKTLVIDFFWVRFFIFRVAATPPGETVIVINSAVKYKALVIFNLKSEFGRESGILTIVCLDRNSLVVKYREVRDPLRPGAVTYCPRTAHVYKNATLN
jgi:hypothetical protein